MIKNIEIIVKKILDLKPKFKNNGIQEILQTRCDYYLNNSLENNKNNDILNKNYNNLEELYKVSERQLPIQNVYQEDKDNNSNLKN